MCLASSDGWVSTTCTVSVIASNADADAVRFYERLGLERFLVSFIGTVPFEAPPDPSS